MRLIYHKGRNFRIPFNLNAEGRDRVKELHLLYSEDKGYHWQPSSRTLPEHPTFTFRSSHDGEFWFAVQTLTVDGKVSPKLDTHGRTELEGRGRYVSADIAPGPGCTPRELGLGALGGQG